MYIVTTSCQPGKDQLLLRITCLHNGTLLVARMDTLSVIISFS